MNNILEKIDMIIDKIGHEKLSALFLQTYSIALDLNDYDKIEDNIWIAKSAKVAPTAFIAGPAIIGKNAEIRHCAFIRGNAIVGENAVVGNSTGTISTGPFASGERNERSCEPR